VRQKQVPLTGDEETKEATGDKNYFAPGRPGSPGALDIGRGVRVKEEKNGT
jgi:hypothetical protein